MLKRTPNLFQNAVGFGGFLCELREKSVLLAALSKVIPGTNRGLGMAL
jgi:hypothetical protein